MFRLLVYWTGIGVERVLELEENRLVVEAVSTASTARCPAWGESPQHIDPHPKKTEFQNLRGAHHLLILKGTQIIERGMPPSPILERFQILKGSTSRLCSCLK